MVDILDDARDVVVEQVEVPPSPIPLLIALAIGAFLFFGRR